MKGHADFAKLLAEAEARPARGWNFSWLGRRMVSSPLPWDYEGIVHRHARASTDMLDLGTGGGEWLAALPYRPPRTVATEGWEPNVAVAGARLRPLGITVVAVEGAPDNAAQTPGERRGRLPFPAESFRLVVNRHESFVATEVARVLAPGGAFVTQQVGGGVHEELHRLLGVPLRVPPRREWNLSVAIGQVEAAGLRVVESGQGEEVTAFADVGAVAWYLKAVPWAVPGFSPITHRPGLTDLHRRLEAEGSYEIREPGFWLEAVKPDGA